MSKSHLRILSKSMACCNSAPDTNPAGGGQRKQSDQLAPVERCPVLNVMSAVELTRFLAGAAGSKSEVRDDDDF